MENGKTSAAAFVPVSAAVLLATDDLPAPAASSVLVAAPKFTPRAVSSTPEAAALSAALPGEALLSHGVPAVAVTPPAINDLVSPPNQPKKRKPTEFGLLFGSFMKTGIGNVRAMAAAKEAWASRKGQL